MSSCLHRCFWRWSLAWLLTCSSAWPLTAQAAQAGPARLLVVVDAVAVASPWYGRFFEALRAGLRERHPNAQLDVETFSRAADFPRRDGVPPQWLLQKYAGRRYDIVMVGSSDFVGSVAQLRDRCWPQATLVMLATTRAQRAALGGAERAVGLTPADGVRDTLAVILQLLPRTRQVAVIASTLDDDPLRWDWRTHLGNLAGRVAVIDLTGLPVDVLRERVRSLPPDTAIFFAAPGTTVGRVSAPRDLLADLVAVAAAPVFVDASTMLGTGAVGGAVVSPEGVARDAARQMDALLAGTPPERIGFVPLSPAQPMFDWQALQRWRIPVHRLPADSVVLDRPPGLWAAYRGQVIAGGAVVVVQGGLITALLFERRRRRQAELRARAHLAELARLNRGAALGALSAALAHEINQPLGAILSNAETAELLLEAPEGAPPDALRGLLAAIREDDLRAAAVLQRLRAWIANAPGALQPTALNRLVTEVARLLATELRLRDTELQLVLAPALPDVLADAVQVQQVVLNLVLNALDALQAVPARERRIVVSTRLHGSREAEVSVRDNGPGLGDVAPERLFEPFFTTKPQGLGVGLAISRSIVERHRGRLRFEAAGGGACFRFTLPVVRPAAGLARAA